MTSRALALALVAALAAACASTPEVPPAENPNTCAFWLEAPASERLAIVAATHEKTFAGIEAKGVALPPDWTLIKACVASRYSEQLRMIEEACKVDRDPVQIFQQSGAFIYSECAASSGNG